MKILIYLMFGVCSLILPIELHAEGAKRRVIGQEFQVNTQGAGDQVPVSITMATDGSYEITWRDYSNKGWYTQKYDPNGNIIGGNTDVYLDSWSSYKTKAITPDGSYVKVWISRDYSNPDIIFASINYEKFDALSGQVYYGKAFEGGYPDYYPPTTPAVGISSSGSFVITWAIPYSGIFARKFDLTGNPLGDVFLVNTNTDGYEANVAKMATDGYQSDPSIAMADDESFVITWQKTVPTSNSIYDVFARRFDDNCEPIGSDFKVNSYINSYQWHPLIAMAPDGSFVITWASHQQDGDGFGVFAKGFLPLGKK